MYPPHTTSLLYRWGDLFNSLIMPGGFAASPEGFLRAHAASEENLNKFLIHIH